jgi:tripartite-type tricarboxylate transporter receptor subunit TctC
MKTPANPVSISRRLFLGAVAAELPFATLAAADYPSRLIKIVVPVPPGAATDTLARVLAQKLSAKLKTPVIVENRAGGAGGNVGAEAVANSEPDGYTLLFAAPGPLVVNKYLYPKLGYDPEQLVPITAFAAVTFVLLTRANAPFRTVREMIEYAKANPGKLNYATGGSGTTTHLSVEMLKSQAGIDLTHVPYRGSAAATNGLMQGQVDLMFVELASMLPHIRSGRIRALAVGARQRVASLPEVQTMAETLPGFFVNVWYGLVAPPKTSPEIAAKLSAASSEALKAPDVVAMFQSTEMQPIGNTPQEFKRLLHEEGERWGTVIRTAKVKIE